MHIKNYRAYYFIINIFELLLKKLMKNLTLHFQDHLLREKVLIENN